MTGFGAVFTNVVLRGVTTIVFYDSNRCVIAELAAPTQPDGLSFAGIIVLNRRYRPEPRISRVAVTMGNAAIRSPYYRWKNFVVADDLIYGEPRGLRRSNPW